MAARKRPSKQVRQRYPDEFKAEAVTLADRVGVTEAASDLGIQTSQIYGWRAKLQRAESTSAAEDRLQIENAKLKQQLAEQKEELALLKKASAYFARNQK